MRNAKCLTVSIVSLGTLVFSGCRVDSHKQGDSDNVKIATPFGGMQVKTNDAAVREGTGLPDYPGATLVKRDKDNGAADIDMSFGSFKLRVKALSYQTGDSPEKVQAFYKGALGRFGDVIQCTDERPVGTPKQTAEGLTCEKSGGKHIQVNDDVSTKLQLKAGSPQHQHIVAIEQEGGGTKFALIALDLPGHLSTGDTEESSQ